MTQTAVSHKTSSLTQRTRINVDRQDSQQSRRAANPFSHSQTGSPVYSPPWMKKQIPIIHSFILTLRGRGFRLDSVMK